MGVREAETEGTPSDFMRCRVGVGVWCQQTFQTLAVNVPFEGWQVTDDR